MPNTIRGWLTVVILLVLFSFYIVTEPVTWGERRRPDNPKLTEKGAFNLGPLNFYAPVPRIRLGLDLQGGSHVVLRAKRQVDLPYETSKVLYTNEAGAIKLRDSLAASIPQDLLDRMESPQLTERKVTLRFNLEDNEDPLQLQQDVTKIVESGPLAEYKPKAMKLVSREIKPSMLNQVAGIMERRINKLGLSEAVVQVQPPDRLIVEMPGMKDPDMVLRTIRSTAKLQLIHIDKRYMANEENDAEGRVIFKNANDEDITKKVITAGTVILEGDELEPTSRYQPGVDGGPTVAFQLKPDGAAKFYEFTRTHHGEVLASVLDDEVIVAATIQATIKDRGEITGLRTIAEANRIAELLNAGSLPVPLEVAENRTVGATLGRDSLQKSLFAGMVGLALVLIFMVAYYRLPGLLADGALVIYCILLLGLLKMFDATLTLPGIAGLIISIGMAVDANVIIFERLKEELRAGKTLRSGIDAAFKRAFTAILDSNVCSIITAIVLMSLGTGAVKGFAVTLLLGVVCSLFTAITVTRLFMNMAANSGAKSLKLYGITVDTGSGQLPAAGGQGA